ncbi:MAG TPA: DinB family protein [Vicinamibacterales bacterium]|jgi:uncharacterized damage-inducible protein DinB|nr:DinB family protein [Vicinamibacterales bacterium]
MSMTAGLIAEFENEAKTTRRVLERVPNDKLTWRPHPKSMTIGHLALHVAASPGVIADWAAKGVTEFTGQPGPDPATAAEIVAAHDKSCAIVKSILEKLGDEGLQGMWEAKAGGKTLMAMPKAALVRALVLNHWYHHRGQLSVYLRLIDVPVPSIYGPSADENPFAARV